jgi:hypothetical protein
VIIYKTSNLINGRIYVGKDKHNNPKYLGSGNIFQQQTKFATPIASVLDGFKKTMQQLSKAEDVEDWTWKEYKNLIRSGGVVLKLPVNLMTSAGQFTSRLNNYFDGNIKFEELVFGEQK